MPETAWRELEERLLFHVREDEKIREALDRLRQTDPTKEVIAAVRVLLLAVLKGHSRTLKEELSLWMHENLG